MQFVKTSIVEYYPINRQLYQCTHTVYKHCFIIGCKNQIINNFYGIGVIYICNYKFYNCGKVITLRQVSVVN